MLFGTQDLIRLAAAGGGFSISASTFPVDDLIRIAAAAGQNGSKLVITEINLHINELIRIAAAGKGSVYFNFEA